jgi:hypothetical protein
MTKMGSSGGSTRRFNTDGCNSRDMDDKSGSFRPVNGGRMDVNDPDYVNYSFCGRASPLPSPATHSLLRGETKD